MNAIENMTIVNRISQAQAAIVNKPEQMHFSRQTVEAQRDGGNRNYLFLHIRIPGIIFLGPSRTICQKINHAFWLRKT